jgi:hypothetical protein
VHDIASISAEDGVILTLTGNRVARVATLAQAVEFTPEIPATGSLTDVSADGPLVAKLRTRHFSRGLREGAIALGDQRVTRDLRDRGERTDSEASVSELGDPAKLVQFRDAHHRRALEDIVTQASE